MTIFENRGRRTLNEASTVEEFLGLRADLGAFALGSYFAELLETVSAEEYPDPPVLQLGLNSLYALSRALCPPEQIKAVFELRLMCLAGYEPDLSCCARCGAPEPAEPWLSLRGGAVYCAQCRGASSSAVTPLLPETLAALAEAGLLGRSAMVCNCGLPDEEVWPDLSACDASRPAGYFATILVKEG